RFVAVIIGLSLFDVPIVLPFPPLLLLFVVEALTVEFDDIPPLFNFSQYELTINSSLNSRLIPAHL
ncbi:unnamed protein product, partial [Rotaria sp. Silwood1]